MNFPVLTPEQLQRSAELSQHIAQNIQDSPEKIISFSDYMELALYTPVLGYYMADHPIFGVEGDFITAPEFSPLFARCLANPVAQVLAKTNGNILEIGAGSGKLAADLLKSLPELPKHYYIVEISPALRKRQQIYLQQTIPEHYSRIVWLEEYPKNFVGMIMANEVIDALPAECFTIQNDKIFARGVAEQNQQLIWKNYPAPSSLENAIMNIQNELGINFYNGYQSEVCLRLEAWLKNLSASLTQGVILIADYGFNRKEYYHPERNMGTLMCHYKQQINENPFWYPGLQDITVHVDFDAVAKIATQNHLEILGFSSQAEFLLDCGLLNLASAMPLSYALQQQIQWLTSPAEMGERFKVMALKRGCEFYL